MIVVVLLTSANISPIVLDFIVGADGFNALCQAITSEHNVCSSKFRTSTLGRNRSPKSETEIDFYKAFPSNLMQEFKNSIEAKWKYLRHAVDYCRITITRIQKPNHEALSNRPPEELVPQQLVEPRISSPVLDSCLAPKRPRSTCTCITPRPAKKSSPTAESPP